MAIDGYDDGGDFKAFFSRCRSGLSGMSSLMSIASGLCSVASEVALTGGGANSFFSMPMSPGEASSTISKTMAILVHLRCRVYLPKKKRFWSTNLD